jgi:hypothetical protein
MPADYLSRLPSLSQEAQANNIIAAFDPFQPNQPQLQNQDSDLQAIFHFLKMASGTNNYLKGRLKLWQPWHQRYFWTKINSLGSDLKTTNIQ